MDFSQNHVYHKCFSLKAKINRTMATIICKFACLKIKYMNKLIYFLLSLSVSSFAGNVFVAPNGSDSNAGTFEMPLATIGAAQNRVQGGDTVFLRGGTYLMTESQIMGGNDLYAYVMDMNKSGSSTSKRICYFNYPGETPILDLSAVKPTNKRITVFYVTGSYLHFKGFEVIGTQVTILTHTQSECFRNDGGNFNVYENLKMHDGQAIGFYLTRGSNNLVLNCDAWNNWDYTSETKKGENSDGFGFHPKKGSSGNVIRGCRAWFNSDDGYDCINAYEAVTFENCYAFYNGYSTAFASLANGNGFKIGGYGQAPVVANLPSPIPSHMTRYCVAYRNKANGFYANHHVVQGNKWYHNTAYRNGTNYNMLSQLITKSSKTGKDTTIDCDGISHVLKNNISFRYSTQTELKSMGTSNVTYNSFTTGSGISITDDDFLSIDEKELILPRNEDGSLPEINFLKLKEGSDCIDAGIFIGYPFKGSKPDLGAFEFIPITTELSTSETTSSLTPNPSNGKVQIHKTGEFGLEIFTSTGKKMESKFNLVDEFCLDISNYPSGTYILKLQGSNEEVFKLMKI